jgi:hypothetical protein
MNYLQEILTDTFILDIDQKILTVQKAELKNIKEIISKIIKKTNLTAFDIAEFELKIIN